MNTSKYIELIEEIKKRPVLYDRNHIHFHDYNKKEHLWNWLSRKFNINAKKKWATLRDKFVRLKRKSEFNADTKKHLEKWDLYESLSFLNNYCKHRKKPNITSNDDIHTTNTAFEFAIVSNNIDFKNLSTEESQELSENNYIAESIFSNHSEFSDYDSTSKNIKNENNNSIEDLPYSKNENLIKFSDDDDTENMVFMKMIGKKLDLLPNKDKNKVQIKILQLVNEEIDKF